MLELPHTVLEIIWGYLDVDDLPNASLTCSFFRDSIHDFIQLECQRYHQKLLNLHFFSPMWNMVKGKKRCLLQEDMEFFNALKFIHQLQEKMKSENTISLDNQMSSDSENSFSLDKQTSCDTKGTLDRRDYFMLRRQKHLVLNNTDAELSGRWEGKYEQFGTEFPFSTILQFDHVTHSFYGYQIDEDGFIGRDFSIIVGTYNCNTVYNRTASNAIQFEQKYRDQINLELTYEGTINFDCGQWRMSGRKTVTYCTFQMVRV